MKTQRPALIAMFALCSLSLFSCGKKVTINDSASSVAGIDGTWYGSCTNSGGGYTSATYTRQTLVINTAAGTASTGTTYYSNASCSGSGAVAGQTNYSISAIGKNGTDGGPLYWFSSNGSQYAYDLRASGSTLYMTFYMQYQNGTFAPSQSASSGYYTR